MGLEEQAVRNDLETYPINLDVEKIKIFEVKGREIPISALPDGSLHSKWSTWVDKIEPHDLERGIADYRHKILGVIAPKDIQVMKQLETRMNQNPSNDNLYQEFEECLLKASTSEFLQIREFKSDSRT